MVIDLIMLKNEWTDRLHQLQKHIIIYFINLKKEGINLLHHLQQCIDFDV